MRYFIISHFMFLSPLCFNTSAVLLLNRRRERAKGRERGGDKEKEEDRGKNEVKLK